MTDTSKFPDPVYAKTVLAPLFDGVKAHFADGMDRINQAHLVMLVEASILSPDDGARIAQALDEITAETDLEALSYDGSIEDYFFYVEGALKARLGDLGGALHTARSRNDMDHTLFRMALRSRAQDLEAQMLDLLETLISKARCERDTLIVAYTHGQPAQPSTFGHYLASIVEVLLNDLQGLQTAISGLGFSPMGAAAITTTGFPIRRDRVAELLGFTAPTRNSYGSIARVDYITHLYSALKLPMVHLGRVIQDMAFWSAFEVGQLYVPNALVQVSSIMPQKRNPVPIEHMRHLASVSAGRCDMVVNTMHNTPHTDMNDSEGELQQSGFAAFESAGRVLRLFNSFIGAVSIDGARVARNSDAACITITELADTLVREEGISFRQAHEIAAATARAVIAENVPLGQGFAAFAAAFEAQIGRASSLNDAAFAEAVDMRAFVTRRTLYGGPAPAPMDEALAVYSSATEDAKAMRQRRIERQNRACDARVAAFNALKGSSHGDT